MVCCDSPQVRFPSCAPGVGMPGMERVGCAGGTAKEADGNPDAQIGSGLSTNVFWWSGVAFLACSTANRSEWGSETDDSPGSAFKDKLSHSESGCGGAYSQLPAPQQAGRSW